MTGIHLCDQRNDVVKCCALVVAVFVIHFLTCGISYSFGVYHVTFLEVYSQSSAVTSWIGSLNMGTLCVTGPLASYMIDTLGVRNTVLIGGLTSSSGLLIGAFSPNLLVLFLSIGVITGIGYGMVFTCGIVVIGITLTKYRTLAMGLSISGIGLGNFVYPFLATYLMSMYGWRGSIMITSAITLHVCLFAMFMVGKTKFGDTTEERDETRAPEIFIHEMSNGKLEHDALKQMDKLQNPHSSSLSLTSSHISNRQLHRSFRNLKVRPYLTDLERARSTELLYSIMGRSTSRTNIHTDAFNSLQSLSNSRSRFPIKSEDGRSLCSNGKAVNGPLMVANEKIGLSPLVTCTDTDTTEYNCTKSQTVTDISCEVDCGYEQSRLYAFTLSAYWLVHANVLLFCLSLSVVLTHTSAYSQHQGVSQQHGSLLISVNGVANVLGRVLLGAVTQRPAVNPFLLYFFCYFIAGATILLMTTWTSLPGLMTCVAIFGLFSAAYGPVLSEVTLEVVGVTHFNYGYGFLMISMALGTTLGAPLAGWLYDITELYTSSFYFGGSCLGLSAILILPLVIARAKAPRDLETVGSI